MSGTIKKTGVCICDNSGGGGGIVVSVTPRGAYQAATEYNVGDLVSFNGLSYIAIQQTTGNDPTDTNNWQLLADALIKTFESVSKNLDSNDVVINKLPNGDIDTMVYTTDMGTITKTFGYTSGDLTSLTLSGNLPGSIDITKTFTYTSGEITGWSYS
jgi:hypothetical protein